jgi:hypothetical protein
MRDLSSDLAEQSGGYAIGRLRGTNFGKLCVIAFVTDGLIKHISAMQYAYKAEKVQSRSLVKPRHVTMKKDCIMARRINWSRPNSRDRMHQHGIEDKKAEASFAYSPVKKKPRKDRPSKAELREQATAAYITWRARQVSEDNLRCKVRMRDEARRSSVSISLKNQIVAIPKRVRGRYHHTKWKSGPMVRSVGLTSGRHNSL